MRAVLSVLAALLLSGDPAGTTPDRVHVAFDGTASLFRLEDPADRLEGDLRFLEFASMGSTVPVDGGEVLRLAGIGFQWPTGDQP